MTQQRKKPRQGHPTQQVEVECKEKHHEYKEGQASARPCSHRRLIWRLLNHSHVLNLSQNPIRGMTNQSRSLMQIIVPLWPPPRLRVGRMPLPLINVGEGFSAIVHCRPWEAKEPHFSRGHEVAGPTGYNTSTFVHHQVTSPRTRCPCQPIVSRSLQHQSIHGWGTLWCCCY